ncbi:MAG TPA: DUF5906 domain-containing protein [Yeosuana sp.]
MLITIFEKANGGNHSLAKHGETYETNLSDLHNHIQSNAWSPATFKDNSRNKENFLGTYVIGLDFDGGVSSANIIHKLSTLGFSYSITASKSHNKEKNGAVEERFRVVIPLTRQITNPEEYAATWQFVNSMFPECDQACKNVDRYYAASPGSIALETNGAHLNPVAATTPIRGHITPQKNSKSRTGILHKDVIYFIENAGSLNGKFNTSLNKAAFMLARGGVSEEVARVILESVSPNAFDSSDNSTFKSGYEGGVKKGLLKSTEKAGEMNDREILEILKDYFNEKFYVVEDDQGRRGNLLEELPNKIVRKISHEKICADIGHLILDVVGSFHDAAACKKHADNWIQYNDALTVAPRTVAFGDYNDLAFHKLDFTPQQGESPLFDEFLSRTTNADALAAFIWSLFVDNCDRQQYVWMYGDGGNGKSSIGDFLGRCLGPAYMAKNSVNAYNNKNFTSTFVNKRLAVFEDSNSTKFVQSGTFKEVTGGGAIEVQFMYEGAYSTHIDTKFIFFSNFQPELSSKLADLRRIILCHVGPITGEPDSHYTDKLWEERAAILYKCRSIYEKISTGKGVIQCEKLDTTSIAMDSEVAYDSVFEEYLNEGGEISGIALYNLIRGSLRNHNIKMTQFKDWLLRQKGVKIKVNGQQTIYEGISK